MALVRSGSGYGLHRWRFKDNPEEKRFARAWYKQQDGKTLAYLLSTDNRPGEVTDRDYDVAATVMQWLGSPVGQYFLKELGYERVPLDDEKKLTVRARDVVVRKLRDLMNRCSIAIDELE